LQARSDRAAAIARVEKRSKRARRARTIFYLAPVVAVTLLVLGFLLDSGSDLTGRTALASSDALDEMIPDGTTGGRTVAPPLAFIRAILLDPPTVPQTHATTALLGHTTTMLLSLLLLSTTITLLLSSSRLTPSLTARLLISAPRHSARGLPIHTLACTLAAVDLVLVLIGSATGGRYISRWGCALAVTGVIGCAGGVLARVGGGRTGAENAESVVRELVDEGSRAITDSGVRGEPVLAGCVELLGEMGVSAVLREDIAIATRVSTALAEMGTGYLHAKHKLGELGQGGDEVPGTAPVVTWTGQDDVDFVALSPKALREIARKGTWVEVRCFFFFFPPLLYSVNR
jgi:hypothetical protein